MKVLTKMETLGILESYKFKLDEVTPTGTYIYKVGLGENTLMFVVSDKIIAYDDEMLALTFKNLFKVIHLAKFYLNTFLIREL